MNFDSKGDSPLKLRSIEKGGVAAGLCGLCDITADPLKSRSFTRPPQPAAVVVTIVHLMRAPVETSLRIVHPLVH